MAVNVLKDDTTWKIQVKISDKY